MRVYITGHRNPDMDSVCSAYAYSVLKNKIDEDNEYIPVMLGKGNRNTVKVFSSLGLEMPMYLHDVRPRVAAVQRKPVTSVKSSDPLFMLMDIFQRLKPSVVPVIDEDGYKALLSADDINAFFLRENRSGARQLYLLSEDNIERTIEGEYVKRSGSDVLRAPYMVGAMEYQVYLERLGRCVDKPVLVIGNRPKHLRAAVEHQLPGIVVTGVSAPSELKIDFSSFHGFVYLSMLDTAETLRLLRLSTPISDIIPSYPADNRIDGDMLFDDAKKKLQDSGFRGLSVFQNGVWTGFVTRRCFLDKPRQKLILMDHNEAEQSVPGIEDGEIIEILDHHRLAAPRMRNPIYICSEPLGSTCSIVYEQFKKWGVDIDPVTARVLLSGLVADTVMLKSPTTTSYDKHVARRLSEIASVNDFDAFCKDIFADDHNLAEKDPKTVIESDMKTYDESGVKFAIGQVEVMNLEEVRDIKDDYLEALETVRETKALDWCMLLITDVIKEESILLATEFEKESRLVYDRIEKGCYSLPGVLSRKKQLLPEILRVLSEK